MTSRRFGLILLVLVLPVLLAVLPGCAGQVNVWEGKEGPPRVVVSIPPLYSFVKSVGGSHVGVLALCTTTGPHEYQYNTKETVGVRKADLLLAVGLGLDESFMDKLNSSSGNSKLHYVEIGEKLPKATLIKPRKEAGEGQEHKHAHKHEHGEAEYDPHVWLGIPEAINMVKVIRDELNGLEAGKQYKAEFDKNAEEYVKQLEGLREQGKELLKDKKDKRLISFHESLEYFAKTFGLEIVDVIEEGPGIEPGAKKMKDLVAKCLKEKIQYIAVEPQYPSSTSAKVLLAELKAKDNDYKIEFIEIDPLETADPKTLDAGWYVTKMKENLKTLADSLK